MVVGNHEFNSGLAEPAGAARARRASRGSRPTRETGGSLAALRALPRQDSGRREGGRDRRDDGAACPQWEKPETDHAASRGCPLAGGGREATALVAARAGTKPDVVDGGGAQPASTAYPADEDRAPGEPAGENRVWRIAEQLPAGGGGGLRAFAPVGPGTARRVGNVPARCSRRNWRGWRWRGSTPRSTREGGEGSLRRSPVAVPVRLLPVTPETASDPRLEALARPYQEATERSLDTPVAESKAELGARAAASRTARSWT